MQMKKEAHHAQVFRRIGAAEAFIDGCLSLGRVAFSLTDLMKETGLSAVAARFQVLRLKEKIVRVSPRQSFFLIVGPEHRAIGAPPPSWWLQDYFNWLGHPYYLALQSAAGLYGSNPQALQIIQVMTDRPRRPLKTGRIRVSFFVKKGIRYTPTRQSERAPAPLCVSTPEATAFDLIRYAAGIGGIERVAETIAPLLSVMRARELEQVLDAENETAVAQRLGFVIESLGQKKLANVVHDWLPSKLMTIPLSPSRIERGNLPVVERWQIRNTSGELKL